MFHNKSLLLSLVIGISFGLFGCSGYKSAGPGSAGGALSSVGGIDTKDLDQDMSEIDAQIALV